MSFCIPSALTPRGFLRPLTSHPGICWRLLDLIYLTAALFDDPGSGLARRRKKLLYPAVLAAILLSVSNSQAAPAPAPIALACPANSGTVGVSYSSVLKATGGVPPYEFSITRGALPAGLTLDANAGTITGRPTAAGSSNFTATVVDSLLVGAGGQPNTTTAACAIAVVKITMDSLEVTQPATPNAVDKTVPAVTPVSSTNTSSAFAAAGSADLVSVLKAGTVTVKGANIQPAAMQRDPTTR